MSGEGIFEKKIFQFCEKNGRGPSRSRSTQKFSEKILFSFLGHMLFNGKGIFNKEKTLSFADIYIYI